MRPWRSTGPARPDPSGSRVGPKPVLADGSGLERRDVAVAQADRRDLFPVGEVRTQVVHVGNDRGVACEHLETLHRA